MKVERLLWWLVAGSRGGVNRARIMFLLHRRPYNANQLASLLGLDYKTVRHHLALLEKHGVVVQEGEGYGSLYFLSEDIEVAFDSLIEIWERIGQERIGDESGSQ